MNTYRIFDKASHDTVMGEIARLDMTRRWTVIVKRFQAKRTLDQNALFHMWCGEIAAFTGDNQRDTKEDLKEMFCPVTSVTERNGIQFVHRHTSDLDIGPMSEFMEKVSAFAHVDLGVRLTVPEEMHVRTAA